MNVAPDRWVAPLFKGDQAGPTGSQEEQLRCRNEMLMTGHDPVTGNRVDQKRYIRELKEAQKSGDVPSLLQNIRRVAAAAVESVSDESCIAGMVAVEASPSKWNWGKEPLYGADIHRNMFNGILPEEVRSRLPDPVVAHHSARTLDEVRIILRLCEQHGDASVDFFTDDYHVERSRGIVKEVRKGMKFPVLGSSVWSPDDVLEGWDIKFPGVQPKGLPFLRDVMDATKLDPVIEETDDETEREWKEKLLKMVKSEESKEKKLAFLMKVRQYSFGKLDPESWILWGLKVLKMR